MALTADRETPRRSGDILTRPAAANKKFYAGSLVAIDASGNATPGATATDILGAGRCREQVDNTGGPAAAVNVDIEKGIFRYANSGSDPVVAGDIGKDCYIVDDFTVSHTDSSQSVAGKVFDIDALGVWVDQR